MDTAYTNVQTRDGAALQSDDGSNARVKNDNLLNSSVGSLLLEDDESSITDSSFKIRKSNRTFNFLFAKRAWKLSGLIYPKFLSLSTLYVNLTVLFSVAEELVAYQVGMIPSKYYGVFGTQDMAAFTSLTLYAIGIVSAIAIIKALKEWFAGRFGVEARKNITVYLHEQCFSGIRHYYLTRGDSAVDNLDQRITTDANEFATTYGYVLSQSTVLPFLIAYYSYDCFTVTGWLGPVSVYIYFIVGAIANKIFMGFLSAWIYKLERKEGDFRYHHAQLRTLSESIAFYRGGKFENECANDGLKQLIDTQETSINRTYFVHSCNYWFSYFGSILSYIIVAIPVFGTTFDDPTAISTIVSKYSFVAMYLINCFSRIFDLSEKLAVFAGFTHRLGELVEVSADMDKDPAPHHITANTNNANVLTVKQLTYKNPGGLRTLCEGLMLDIAQGQNTLVVGPSGCGKSSLMRVLSGLWLPMAGSITLREGPWLYVIPQKAYILPCGSLIDQVTYPSVDRDQSTENCVGDSILHSGLKHITKRLGGVDVIVDNWATTLSPGEVQRLMFARLFYHNPQFAALDESTSSLDEDMERRLYEECTRRGMTLLSVGHRTSLRQFHSRLVELDGNGGWSILHA